MNHAVPEEQHPQTDDDDDDGFTVHESSARGCGQGCGVRVLRWHPRHGIMTAAAPRVATADPTSRKPAAAPGAVPLQGLKRISRAGGREAAAVASAAHKGERGRQGAAIYAHRKNQDVLDRVHALGVSAFPDSKVMFNNPARFSVVRKSCSTTDNFLPLMDCRATRTRSSG